MPELVAGVGLRERGGAFRQIGAGQEAGDVGVARVEVEAQAPREGVVEGEQPGCRRRRRLGGRIESFHRGMEAVVEGEGHRCVSWHLCRAHGA